MTEKTIRLLEFDAIRSRAAACARSEEAARRLRETMPRTGAGEVAELKALVSGALERLNSGDEEPGGSLPEIGFLISKLEVAGVVLEPDEAYALGVFTERGEALKRWILAAAGSARGDGTPAGDGAGPPALRKLASELPDCSAVYREVFRVLDREGNLRDLPEFREIKRRIRTLNGDLEAIVARYAGNENTRRMLQSGLPSQRDGRMVLALKANFRGRIKGIVHEVSATGQTIFVEPEDVVEKNNDIIIEQRRLDAEIRRVFREMTGRIAGYRPVLEEFHGKLIHIETIRARARYSRDSGGHFAGGAGRGAQASLVLKQARHPLLGPKATPIDFAMEGDTRRVIITGPNTGGKTVTLKTVGLFALMNQYGLALPAAEGTVLPVFDGIYADIGDEQSLDQSLSTFSGHMTNIAAIAGAAGEDSLVLLDELGSGTDPQEGSAIAMAILDYFAERGSRLIATTHHGILKNYGYTRPGVENASVEFDGRTLSPTYRIVMGIPGESRAVDIAAGNGLPPAVVEGARAYLEGERSDVSALISGLKQKHQELDAVRLYALTETERLREERRRADLKELSLRQRELQLREGAVGNLRRLLSESRKTLENLVRELKEGELTREKTRGVKDFLSDLESAVIAGVRDLEGEDEALEAERLRLEAEEVGTAIGYADGIADGCVGGGKKGHPDQPAPELVIAPGTEVLAGPSRRRGTVLRAGRRGAWIVAVGSLRMTLEERELIPVRSSPKEEKPLISRADLADDTQAKFELNLRGMRLEEALDSLGRQIDAALLSGLREFSVIHGKGDGILQQGVHEFLKKAPQVADYYFSRPELGGFGRTEVILKG
ncbi:MAG: Smr/MutS family protein [Treponema sp.]|jgi:DNA mismatch repair protein MutS2|nr:Smr/MutS family protein [Treponema sp.]